MRWSENTYNNVQQVLKSVSRNICLWHFRLEWRSNLDQIFLLLCTETLKYRWLQILKTQVLNSTVIGHYWKRWLSHFLKILPVFFTIFNVNPIFLENMNYVVLIINSITLSDVLLVFPNQPLRSQVHMSIYLTEASFSFWGWVFSLSGLFLFPLCVFNLT